MEAATRDQMANELKSFIEAKDFRSIHIWLCHPYTKKCGKLCNRSVDPYRLALYGEIIEHVKED